MLFSSLVTSIILGVSGSLARSVHRNSGSRLAPSPFIVQQFSSGTWIENLAVRSNGLILATDDTHARLYQVDPFTSSEAIVVAQFTDTASVLGIVETEEDVFYVCTANYSSAKLQGYGEAYIYKVDLSDLPQNEVSPAKVTKIVTVNGAGALDGLAYLASGRVLLVSDFLAGLIWSVDIDSGAVEVAINNTYTQSIGFQVNGLKTRGDDVYFTTTSAETLVKVCVDSKGRPTGPFEVLAKDAFLPDDFALDIGGNAYVTNFDNDANGIVFVPAAGGEPQQVANITGPTGAAFGRTAKDCHVLYVSTTGGDYDRAANGTFIGAGAVVGVDLKGYAGNDCHRGLV